MGRGNGPVFGRGVDEGVGLDHQLCPLGRIAIEPIEPRDAAGSAAEIARIGEGEDVAGAIFVEVDQRDGDDLFVGERLSAFLAHERTGDVEGRAGFGRERDGAGREGRGDQAEQRGGNEKRLHQVTSSFSSPWKW
jgi:hypothetical protein